MFLNTKVDWREGYDPGLIARLVESIAKREGSKLVSFEGFEYYEYATLLYSMLEFPDSVPEVQGRNMVHDAISRAGNTTAITADGIKRELDDLVQEYLSQPYEHYVLTEV